MFPTDEESSAGPIVPAGLHLAPFARRIPGLIVDELVVVLPVLGVFWLAGYTPGDVISGERADLESLLATVVVGLLYETLMIWRFGRTLGKFLCGTRVVSVVDGGPLDLTRSFQRSLVPTSLGAIPQVGMMVQIGIYVWAFMDPLRQGIHDKAAGSIVVLARHPAPVD